MRTTAFSTQESILSALARGSIRAAASETGCDKKTVLQSYQALAKEMPKWLLGTFGKGADGLVLHTEFMRLSSKRATVGYRAIAWTFHEPTAMVLGFGAGASEDTAKESARAMTSLCVANPSFAQGLPRGAHHRPRGMRSYVSDEGILSALWFKFTLWNICSLIDGRTPAMRLGMAERPWTAADLLRAAGFSDDVAAHAATSVSPEKHSNSLEQQLVPEIARVKHHPPNLCALRDAYIKSISFGKLHVEEIRYSASSRAGRMVPGIERCVCRCECGGRKEIAYGHLMSGAIVSCGCKSLEAKFGLASGAFVEVMGQSMSIGQLATLSGKSPTVIAAAMRRGATPEQAAFGAKVDS